MNRLLLILILASFLGSCTKSRDPEKPAQKTFAGTYVGTTHRWYERGDDTSNNSGDRGIYSDSVMIITWTDSIRFRGISSDVGSYMVDVRTKDTGLFHHLTVSYGMRYNETSDYYLSASSDSLNVHYIYHTSGPNNQFNDLHAEFRGLRR